jgi:hypothetical protein
MLNAATSKVRIHFDGYHSSLILEARQPERQQNLVLEMKNPRQIVMHCPCGNAMLLAKRLYSTCYTLKHGPRIQRSA